MNTKNNKRRRESQDKIEGAFIELLQSREITDITVSDICKKTSLNRSTFYANYSDIYDLADKICDKLKYEVNTLYDDGAANSIGIDYLRLFYHIKENRLFYATYFKLGYDRRHIIDLEMLNLENQNILQENIEYHIEFHKAGLNAIIMKWINAGCDKAPEEMVRIVESEYRFSQK